MDKIKRIKELIKQLNIYRDEYYNNANPSVSDQEYDKLFDELSELEKETGIYMSNSPTQSVGYEVKSELEKVTHSHPMLSLDKTKSVDDLRNFAKDKNCLLSLKMDGLTVLLTYENGELIQAESRGNGEEGELITHNAKVFENIPLKIDYKGHLEIEGEAIITYESFEEINSKLYENDKYKNPRNLVSGSVRQLDSNIAAKRHIKFVAWKVPTKVDDSSDSNSFLYRLNFVKNLGFDIVSLFTYVDNSSDKDNLEKMIEALKEHANRKGYPIDGLVMTYDDIEYGKSLGNTGHHPKHSVAFKFYDDVYETTLKDIEWSMGKTGILTPVAIFKPVEIDGTEVSRASLHNWSMCQELELGIGDTITVYKANQIIPQLADNLTRSNTVNFPDECPICGALTKIVKENDTKVLMCSNDDCQGRLLGKLSHAASKNALNIDGLSEATLEYMIEELGVKSIKDLYQIPFYKEVYEKWIKTPGFGKRSVDKLRDAIEKSRNTTLERFLYAQSINLIGKTASKDISKYCKGSIDTFCDIMANGNRREFLSIDGFGQTMLESLENWYENHWIEFLALKSEFNFEEVKVKKSVSGISLDGKTFVITGSLEHFANREALVEVITSLNGKVSGSVSAKTSYLINNDVNSSSSKNVKAKSLNIPIISEQDFMKMIEGD
jgi:DNA ligase (NAD+)